VPGDHEGSRGDGDLGAAGSLGRGKEGSLKLLEDLPGVGAETRVGPAGSKGSGKLGALGDPLGDTRSGAGKVGGEPMEREENREMIRKRGTGGRVGTVVGGVGEDGNISGGKRVGKKGRRDQETIDTGGTEVGRQGVGGGEHRAEPC